MLVLDRSLAKGGRCFSYLLPHSYLPQSVRHTKASSIQNRRSFIPTEKFYFHLKLYFDLAIIIQTINYKFIAVQIYYH